MIVRLRHPPLKIVWSGILVFSIGTKWADVARRVMDEAMPDHFVLALEPLSTFASWTTLNAAVVWTILGMYICMRIQKILWYIRPTIARGIRVCLPVSEMVAHYSLDTCIEIRRSEGW